MATQPTQPQASAEPYKNDSRIALARAASTLNQVILGKAECIRLCLACLLARGHLLLEDIPGVGKTTLARAIAKTLGLSFRRVQFTSDLLPADITGVSVFDAKTQTFRLHRGPIFSQLILADEVNRATPKSQSALLEAMEESQVTIDGETHALPTPFFVIATQNPIYQIGTFQLPESQLDRFLMRVEMGYPDAAMERKMLTGDDRKNVVDAITPQIKPEELVELQNVVTKVHMAEPIIDYIQSLIRFSRESNMFETGLSPRAGIRLVRASQAWALMHGHKGVMPEDVQAVVPSVVSHRLRLRDQDQESQASISQAGRLILESVPLP